MTEAHEAPAVPQGEARLLIGGELVESKSGQFFDNINPATEQVIGQTSELQPRCVGLLVRKHSVT